jgi:hypothetical protein
MDAVLLEQQIQVRIGEAAGTPNTTEEEHRRTSQLARELFGEIGRTALYGTSFAARSRIGDLRRDRSPLVLLARVFVRPPRSIVVGAMILGHLKAEGTGSARACDPRQNRERGQAMW